MQMIFELKEVKSLLGRDQTPPFFPKIIYASTTKFLVREVQKTYELLETKIKKKPQQLNQNTALTLIEDQILSQNEIKFIESIKLSKAMVSSI